MPMMPMFQPVPENSTMTSETLPNFMDTAGVLQRSKVSAGALGLKGFW